MKQVAKRRIAVVLNASWNIFNFRLGLMRNLQKLGYEMIAVAPRDNYSGRIPFPYHELPMSTRGVNPVADAALLLRTIRLYRMLKPDAVLHFTPKPNVYGSIAAAILGIPAISNIAGLGSGFGGRTLLRFIMENLYRFSLRKNCKVFFQNTDDMRLFLAGKLVRSDQAARLPGSGIDLDRFRPAEPGVDRGDFRFLLVSRMLWAKGVGDFVEAARILKSRGIGARFQLFGFLEKGNPAAISREQMYAWTGSGLVEYLDESDDVRREMTQADCVVLPSSYREGVPRVLLEAAAMGKPVVAYDNAGVRDAVEHGGNGYLAPMGDIAALADAMERLIAMGPGERAEMGRRGREKMEREFGEAQVLEAYRIALADIFPERGGGP